MTHLHRTLTDRDIAKTIDHSLLRPELDDAFVEEGCRLAASTTSRRSASGRSMSRGPPRSCAGTRRRGRHVDRLPARQPPTETKVFEARRALERRRDGARHGHRDRRPQVRPRRATSRPTSPPSSRPPTPAGAIVKVIFENAYLTDDEKVRACRLTEAAGAEFVKTSTGFARRRRHARRPHPETPLWHAAQNH